MTKEIYHEGWLIKSPPTKRIWRARWRRRWFTLKQGEIPEQFCLEYYADRACRKLKGVIDLDQCEQVDSGLKLEDRKQKFQHMFDVKTPRRTYYLAADSEEDMTYWVNCICQVCNLQDLSKQQNASNDNNRQYYNLGAESIVNQPMATSSPNTSTISKNPSLNEESQDSTSQASPFDRRNSVSAEQSNDNNNSVYQNFDIAFHNSTYNNRETLICDGSFKRAASLSAQKEPNESYYNFVAIANDANRHQQFERSHSMRTTTTNNESNCNDANGLPTPNHGRTQSLIERKTTSTLTRKIPENLKLNDTFANDTDPSPSSLSTSSGPYIAISECISGNPLIDRENPTTPLNSLDPKFYEMPRSHINNIGLNLTNDQPYSPKRNNCPTNQPTGLSRSGRSSPTDSESVFTDDEEWPVASTTDASSDRKLRPSDSSVDFTYAQRFSKLPYEENAFGETASTSEHVRSRRIKHVAGLLLEEDDNDERNKEVNSSDTENASPAIPFGPKDITSCVDENYDIPRSHHLPYYSLNSNSTAANDQDIALTPFDGERTATASLAGSTSTLNSSTLQRPRPHFYTNAAPTKMEGNVFRYDFDEQSDAPIVDRKLKPKMNHLDEKEEKNATIILPPTKPSRPTSTISITSSVHVYGTITITDSRPPCIDRKLKPATPVKFETCSLHRRGGPSNLSFAASTSNTEFQTDLNADKFSKTLPRNYNNSSLSTSATATTTSTMLSLSLAPMSIASNASGRQIGKLEYFDLDHSNAPPICKNVNTSVSTSDLSSYLPNSCATSIPTHPNLHSHRHSGFGSIASTSVNHTSATGGTLKKVTHNDAVGMAPTTVAGSGIVYKSVDFIKTEAFMRTRQDAELNRAKNRLKE